MIMWQLLVNVVLIVQTISTAARDEEYFHAERMVATSVVHGGPGPRFLSEMLYQHLTGRTNTDIEAKIKDINDDTMRASLLEVSWHIDRVSSQYQLSSNQISLSHVILIYNVNLCFEG